MDDAASILVVDDEPAIRFALHAFLTQLRFDVDCAESVEGAVGFLEQKDYDALLVDFCGCGAATTPPGSRW